MGRPPKYSDDDVIESLHSAADELGKSPTTDEYRNLNISPSIKVIKSRFGSWNNAKEEAGLSVSSSTNLSPPPKILNISQNEWDDLSRQGRLQKRKRADAAAYKIDKGCAKCGYDEHHAALEFHHLKDKDLSISTMISRTYGDERIRREIEKCEVLCSNCHAIETHG